MNDSEKCTAMWNRFQNSIEEIAKGKEGCSTREVGEVMIGLFETIETREEFISCYYPKFFKPYLESIKCKNEKIYMYLLGAISTIALSKWYVKAS